MTDTLHDCADCNTTHRSTEPCPVDAKASTAWTLCEPIATASDVLAVFDQSLDACGIAGERDAARLLFLVGASRHFDKVLSAYVHGPSAAGKSELVRVVFAHFDPSSYYFVTGMSDKALLYSDINLQHRVLAFAELTGADQSDTLVYLLRTLLSEGRLRYEATVRDPETQKFITQKVEREGPTALVVTSTATSWHDENMTRMLAVAIDDSPEQTKRVMEAQAAQLQRPQPDLEPWRAFDRWLATGDHRVAVPFARRLAELVPPVAVSLRRGFVQLLLLIMAHALLHRASRPRDEAGRIVATLSDYAAVYDLVLELFGAGSDAKVSQLTIDTVDVVRRLTLKADHVSVTQVARALKLDPSSASRRVRVALQGNYLVNLEPRDGRPFKLVVGDLLPDERALLPAPDSLALTTLAPVQTLENATHASSGTADTTSPDPCTLAPDLDVPAWVIDTTLDQVTL